MEREEQIQHEAWKYSNEIESRSYDGRPDWEDHRWAFESGAEWADKNPIVDLPKLLAKERRVWLDKACDVIRNTKMDVDLRSHLINSIMRL